MLHTVNIRESLDLTTLQLCNDVKEYFFLCNLSTVFINTCMDSYKTLQLFMLSTIYQNTTEDEPFLDIKISMIILCAYTYSQ